MRVINIILSLDAGMVMLDNITHIWSKEIMKKYKIDEGEVWQCPYHILLALSP
jgi:hypothetical protein